MIELDERATEGLADLADEALARRSFEAFCGRMDPAYRHLRHAKMLCDHLQALADGDIQKLMVFMPPRHGKTYHSSERFPAWFLGRRPNSQIIIASYTIKLAREASSKARGLFKEDEWPFFDAKLDPLSQAVDEWKTTDGGLVLATGVGGTAAGFGANLLIIDDPVKNREEANSEVDREKKWTWYTEVAARRVQANLLTNEPGKELICTTRWHEDDICGRILDSGAASEWTILRLPAIAEENDPLGRDVGEPLAPELGVILPKPELGQITLRGFEALYQGNPTPAEGALFKRAWFSKRYRELPTLVKAALFLDGAWKEGVGTDRSAIGLWATDGVNYYLVDAWAKQVEYPDLKPKVKDYWNRWQGIAPVFTPCVEDAASGIPLIQEFKRTTNIPLVGVKVDKSKYTRAEAVTPLFEAGKCFLPEDAPWLDEWIEEHVSFPGKHDDLVDTTSGALARLANASTLTWAVARNTKA